MRLWHRLRRLRPTDVLTAVAAAAAAGTASTVATTLSPTAFAPIATTAAAAVATYTAATATSTAAVAAAAASTSVLPVDTAVAAAAAAQPSDRHGQSGRPTPLPAARRPHGAWRLRRAAAARLSWPQRRPAPSRRVRRCAPHRQGAAAAARASCGARLPRRQWCRLRACSRRHASTVRPGARLPAELRGCCSWRWNGHSWQF